MEDLASVTNLRILGGIVAFLLIAVFVQFIRLRKLKRREGALQAALLAQKQGLRLRDHIIAQPDGFRLILDKKSNIIIRAGDPQLIADNTPADADFEEIKSQFVTASMHHLENFLDDETLVDQNARQKLITREGRKQEVIASKVKLHGEMLTIFQFMKKQDDDGAPKVAPVDKKTKVRAVDVGDQYQIALDVVDIPSWRRNKDLSIAWCNQAYADIVESSITTVIENSIEIENANTSGQARKLANRAVSERRSVSDLRHTVVSGDRRALRIQEMPLPSGGTIGYSFDMTELEESLSEIDRLVETQADVLNQLNASIAIFAADKKLSFFNEAYIRVWGQDRDWLESEPSHGEILSDLQDARQLPEQANFAEYREQQFQLYTDLIGPSEELIYRPDGRIFRRVIAPNPRGGLIFIDEDVTDVLALERSYNNLIATQSETLDSLLEGLAVFGTDLRLKLFNPAFARLWKLDPMRLEREPHLDEILELIKPLIPFEGNWEKYKSDISEEVASRETITRLLNRPDETVIESTSVALPDGNKLIIHVDVSDSQKIERFLRERNLALEGADRVKSIFFSNISYALRTPLTSISGFTDIIRSGLLGKLEPRQNEYIENISNAADDLRRLIDDILDLAGGDADRADLSFDLLDIVPMIENWVGEIRTDLDRQDVSLDLQISDPGDELKVIADAIRLRQILEILITNAVNYSKPEGKVVIQLSRDQSHLAMTVEDQGLGIPVDEKSTIFERFQRGSNVTHVRGVGLGLALARLYINLHGGAIDVHSELDVGTQVVCRFPLNGPSPEQEQDFVETVEQIRLL